MNKGERNRLTNTLMVIQEYADAAHRESERNFALFTSATNKRDRAHYLRMTDDSRHESYAYRESIRLVKECMNIEGVD